MNSMPIVVITGSSRGIGAATARLFAKNGYAVCINYRANEEAALEVQKEIKKLGARCIVVQADVSREDEVVRLFEAVDKKLGRLDVLINNAGILMQQSRLEDLDAERINKLLITNVTSCFICSREAVKRMSTKHSGEGGAIVNVSSVAATLGAPNEYTDYAATKGAIDTLTRGLAVEVAGEGIRVNGVRPGIIDTEIHADGGEPGRVHRLASAIPIQRGGTAEEVAQGIYWLASNEASYATGAIIDLTGGR
ncbi:MAG: SDR family oxidoreductase [Pseudomonadales bacterium]|nr:SDR family oxidoreductase [Pseudomonadales bacterium]